MSSAEMHDVFAWLLFLIGPQWTFAPIAVPPAPEDPKIVHSLPASAPLFLYLSNGRAAGRPDAANPWEQLAAKPEVVELVRNSEKLIDAAIARHLPQAIRPEEAQLYRWVTSEAGALVITELVPAEGSVLPVGYALIRLGETGRHIPDLWERVVRSGLPEGFRQETLDGVTFWTGSLDGGTMMSLTFVEGYALAAIGPDAQATARSVMQRMRQGMLPGWLVDLDKHIAVPRRSTLLYLDIGKLLDPVTREKDTEGAAFADALGLTHLSQFIAVTGLDDRGYSMKAKLILRGAPAGIWRAFTGPALSRQELSKIPADAFYAVALRLDAGAAWKDIMARLQDHSPMAAQAIQSDLDRWESQIGLKVQDELTATLGDTLYVYATPSVGGIVGNWVAAVELRDPQRARQLLEQHFLPRLTAALGEKTLYRREVAGTIVYAVPTSYLVMPAWAVSDRELLVSLLPQSLIDHLQQPAEKKTFFDRPELLSLWKDDSRPIMLTVLDTRARVEALYPSWQGTWQMLQGIMAPGKGRLLTFPPPAVFQSLASVNVYRMDRTEDGWVFLGEGLSPGELGSGASVGVFSGLLLPAIQAARAAARRAQSSNNLRIIALALHNYHDAHKSFPAAYNADRQGKPLLSWRVHILPYLGEREQDLYREFHLDEPWDSEHNRKLIERIPEVYRSPHSQAPPGYTTYLAVTGTDAVFIPPRDSDFGREKARGTSFVDIADGTVNTVVVVEASDEKAVPWTKPEDFPANTDDPANALWHDPANRKVHILFADGLDYYGQLTDAQLKAFFTRAGGEPVVRP